MNKMAKRKIPDPVSQIETFRDPRGCSISSLCQEKPSCFNGHVSVFRWRVTVEKIDEPIETITERLEMLWRKSDNHHDYQPLMDAAESIGYTFTGKWGQDRKSS
jgi:hypothetical protein